MPPRKLKKPYASKGRHWIPCPGCGGTGTYRGLKGKIQCPVCKGDKGKWVSK